MQYKAIPKLYKKRKRKKKEEHLCTKSISNMTAVNKSVGFAVKGVALITL